MCTRSPDVCEAKSTSYLSCYIDGENNIYPELPNDIEVMLKLSRYNVPSDWFSINSDNGAFWVSNESKKNSIKYLCIPEKFKGVTVEAIADNCFSNCTNLINVYIPDNVTRFGDSAFANCSSLKTSMSIKDNITYIGHHAFMNSGITFESVDVSNCTSIGLNAFENTTVNKLIVGDNGVVGYDNLWTDGYPFEKIRGFSILELKEGSTILKNVMTESMKESVKTVILPDSLKEIYDYALSNCILLEEIKIPSGTKKYQNSFANTYAKKIYY
ncbi:MAG: leucine-rich repeat protein [Spirochaetales bacterium]|nr:leucine-rich repeat protein [Spirochaetales bacterium]